MVAGLIAGTVIACIHSFLIEPVIDTAIQLEEERGNPQTIARTAPPVARSTQRWGLVAGFLLYGAVWGLLFGLLGRVVHAWEPSSMPVARRALLLAILIGWTVAIFPFVKYPANPPGVGEVGSLGTRQAHFFGFMGLSAIGSVLAFWCYRRLVRRRLVLSRFPGGWAVFILYAAYAVVLYLVMPANRDPLSMPIELVRTFRAISLTGLILFWITLGGTAGWLLQRQTQA